MIRANNTRATTSPQAATLLGRLAGVVTLNKGFRRFALGAACGAALPLCSAHAQTIAITNARVLTAAGAPLERGTVLIRDGRIQAVGASVQVPASARVIDATGKWVTPGFLDSSTGIGTVEISLSADGTVDLATTERRITAAFRAADNLNPFSTLIPITRVEGITRVVVAPASGASLIAGQGLLMDLGNDGPTLTIHRDPVGMFVVLGEPAAALAGGSRGAVLLQLREALQDARDYAANRNAFEAAQRRAYALSRLDLEALVPVLRREVPLVVQAHRASDILAALRVAAEYNLRLVLTGANEAWMVAPQIAAAGVPVVLDPSRNLPTFESLGITFENAARLHAAGVLVAFASFDSHNARNLKQEAGIAVAYGMPYDAALRAVTVNPARIWGIAERYGTLEAGKDADVVVWSADPFEVTTVVEHVFIRGRQMPVDTRQRDLFLRYRTIDGAVPPAYHR
jgi:imidazolonepropionase-like amidohydrolase